MSRTNYATSNSGFMLAQGSARAASATLPGPAANAPVWLLATVVDVSEEDDAALLQTPEGHQYLASRERLGDAMPALAKGLSVNLQVTPGRLGRVLKVELRRTK